MRSFYFLRCLVVVFLKPLKRKKSGILFETRTQTGKRGELIASKCQSGSNTLLTPVASAFSLYVTQQRLLCSFVGYEKNSNKETDVKNRTDKNESFKWESLRTELRRNHIDLFSENGLYVELNVGCHFLLIYQKLIKLPLEVSSLCE